MARLDLDCLKIKKVTKSSITKLFDLYSDDIEGLKNVLIDIADSSDVNKKKVLNQVIKEQQHIRYIESTLKEYEDKITPAITKRYAKQGQKAIDNEIQKRLGRRARGAINDIISLAGARNTASIVSLERQVQQIGKEWRSMLGDALHEYRYRILPMKYSKESQRNFIREIFAHKTDASGATRDAVAIEAAKRWHEVTELMLNRFNKAGGSITKRMDYNVAMFHDSMKVRKATFEQWYNDVVDLIDQDNLVSSITKEGRRRDPSKLIAAREKILKSVYEKLESNGVVEFDSKLLKREGAKMVANRHQEHRLLQFKDGDSYLAYMDKYGTHDPFDSALGTIDMMSREVAAMEFLGPNPDQTLDVLRRYVTKVSMDRNAGKGALNSYDYIMGRSFGNRSTMGDVIKAGRAFETISKLGGATITALTDHGFAYTTSKFIGIKPYKSFMTYLKSVASKGTLGEIRESLQTLGMASDYSIHRLSSISRFSEMDNYGRLTKLADTAIRVSGLNHHTNVAKESFQIEFMKHISNMASTEFENLPTKIHRLLKDTYGFTADDWSHIMSMPKTKLMGVDMLDLSNNVVNPEVRKKVVGMILEETSFAVPEVSAKTRAMLFLGTKSNTISGELVRSLGQFKTFGVSILNSHMMRALNQSGIDRLSYTANLLISTTLLGAVSLQVKELTKGKTLMDMDAGFMFNAFAQGGATGILGDFLFNDPRMYGGLTKGIVGPLVQDVERLSIFMWGTAEDVKNLEQDMLKNAVARGIIGTVDSVRPKLWYTRLALDRAIFDQMNMMLDENWLSKQRSIRRKNAERGQEYWSEPNY